MILESTLTYDNVRGKHLKCIIKLALMAFASDRRLGKVLAGTNVPLWRKGFVLLPDT